jgi:hypothetical protein
VKARLAAVIGGPLLFALVFAVSSSADTPAATSSITAYPAKPYMVGKHQVMLHVQNTGTVAYDVEVRTSAPWIVPSVSKIVGLQPGETAEFLVKVTRAYPHGTQEVSFIIPAPTGSGLAAQGGVAIPLNFDPAASPSPSSGLILWPVLGIVPIALYATNRVRKMRERRSKLRAVRDRLGF